MKKFAEYLGFPSKILLISMSEVAVAEGDIHWYITRMPDGRWAAWDDTELSVERVEYFDTRIESVYYHRERFEATDLPEDAWVL